MNETGLQKKFDDISGLQKHLFFPRLKKDIACGTVFPAVRKNEIRFYHSGGRLCVYRGGRMFTNNRYLKRLDKGKSKDVAISEHKLSLELYDDIKDQCRERWSPEKELRIVSDMFPEFSIGKVGLSANRARLLDIECRFPTKPGAETAQDMIDCLFLTPNHALVFVEVKRTENPAVRSISAKAKVVSQLKRYSKQLNTEYVRSNVISVYGGVIDTLNKLLGNAFAPPSYLFKTIPLLIVGKKSEPTKNSKEVWQHDLLSQAWDFGAEVIGVDGRYCHATNGNPAAALNKFFIALEDQILHRAGG
jgi:hypothetical protein